MSLKNVRECVDAIQFHSYAAGRQSGLAANQPAYDARMERIKARERRHIAARDRARDKLRLLLAVNMDS